MSNLSRLKDERELLSCPGDTILETLQEIDTSEDEFAEQMEEPIFRMKELLSGKELLTNDLAFKLENVLGIPTQFWINREKNYREKLFKIEQQEAELKK